MPDLSYLRTLDPNRFKIHGDQPTMKAVVTTGNGGYEKLDYCNVPIPIPRPGEVLLRVLAAGVNNTEINTRLGWYSSSVQGGTEHLSENVHEPDIKDGGWNEETPFPFIQGTDCCGEVVAWGEGTNWPDIGKRVLVRACMRLNGFDYLDNLWIASDFDGAFAQYVTAPASEVFEIDCDWSDVELATIPCAYGTAENMLHRADVKEADRVLVTGASGGVGSAVVQLAKRRGAYVIAVTGESKLDVVRSLGADQVIPRGSDLSTEVQDSSVDVVIDNVAGEQVGKLLKLMARGGRYASSGAIAGAMTTIDMRDFYLKDLTLIGCTAWDEPIFSNLIDYIEKDDIRPLVARTFELKDIATAQKEFLKKEHFGNFVLVPPL
ncbi:alcohol dehydrogenase family protein [Halomonas sp. ATCH28]|uniref:Alcohol dehydrogenase family protein n=1 Tax=Halomonas gemina TaxID=2945105 RepID=A0ABT0T3N8_9GAMM|nr:alcohol dehydrogenase family protein [Halomonas gemina]MCL7941536.1 alcohol dehydrogenase family protein [Halomonas gemina]